MGLVGHYVSNVKPSVDNKSQESWKYRKNRKGFRLTYWIRIKRNGRMLI